MKQNETKNIQNLCHRIDVSFVRQTYFTITTPRFDGVMTQNPPTHTHANANECTRGRRQTLGPGESNEIILHCVTREAKLREMSQQIYLQSAGRQLSSKRIDDDDDDDNIIIAAII